MIKKTSLRKSGKKKLAKCVMSLPYAILGVLKRNICID